MKKKVLAFFLVGVMVVGAFFAFVGCGETSPESLEVQSAYAVVQGYEWGPAVPKIVLGFADNVSGVDKDTFTVSYTQQWAGKANRTITDAYNCDGDGAKVTGASKYIAIEMSVKYNEASPFGYDMMTARNSWANINYDITVKDGKSVTVGSNTYGAGLTYKATGMDKKVPQTASWQKDTVTEGEYTLTRASWAPEGAATDSGKNPLVIWLHGAGEGGTDIDIDLLGNEVTALTTENSTNVQSYFAKDGLAGAYVLAVQTPTMWMDNGSGEYNNTGSGKQESCYTAALWKAITSYVDGNSDVDTDRIYIGGCSNGGYMTMNMAFEHGDYFAAFYPICEAYMNDRISDEMIGQIKDYNMWFVQSFDDTTVAPDATTVPTVARLAKAGAKNVHVTMFENVKGTDDPTATYMGHFSWIYVFNDQVKKEIALSESTVDDDIKPANCTVDADLWTWIASQKKEAEPEPDVEGTVYTFEAENGVITDGNATTQGQEGPVAAPVTVESGNEYAADGVGPTATNLGYFYADAKVTFTITASEECDAILKVRAASADTDLWNVIWSGGTAHFNPVDLSKNDLLKVSVNGSDVPLSGTLPGLEIQIDDNNKWTIMGDNTKYYRNFGESRAVLIHLNEGENTVEFTGVGANGGVNFDKFTIKAGATLTFTETDNSSRAPQQ